MSNQQIKVCELCRQPYTGAIQGHYMSCLAQRQSLLVAGAAGILGLYKPRNKQ